MTKYIDIGEFRDFGYLQEVNRRFFHPLGLALEVVTEECKACQGTGFDRPAGATYLAVCRCCHQSSGITYRLGGIWDYREDPEGMVFGADGLDEEKATRINREWDKYAEVRKRVLGFIIQSLESKAPPS